MKVFLGSYSRWWHPENILYPFKILFGISDRDYYGNMIEPDGESVMERFEETWLGAKLYRWSLKTGQFKYVKIDPWDTWNMDNTLSPIILPMLKQLKQTKHGSPFVDPKDVPEHLHPTEDANSENGYVDNTHHERWDWVMDEMIFAFESQSYYWQEQFYHGSSDFHFVPITIDGEELHELEEDEKAEYYEMKMTYSEDYYFDKEGHDAYQKRISNGFCLFGKYYQSLWD